MPDSVMYGLLVVGVTALVGALVAGLFGSDLALWLFPVWFGAGVVFLVGGYGIAYVLRMLRVVAIAAAALVAAALVLPAELIATLGPVAFTGAVAVFFRLERRRRPHF
ncbi:hypothetical protein [Solirubrobacter soli]|uniref:hypothetical protein n=1 Tax=Solirubrobacter soli TaxID=363832 RepID=UPI000417DF98|nr:hypothetical protein [Solirubrobacter soli]